LKDLTWEKANYTSKGDNEKRELLV
jgi:hypothetical protein